MGGGRIMAGQIDLISDASTSHVNSYSGDYNATVGTEAEIYDDDGDTYFGYTFLHLGDGTCSANFTSSHTWVVPVTITKITWKVYWDAFMGNYANWSYTYAVATLEGSTWTTRDSYSSSSTSSDPSAVTIDRVVTGIWTGVTGVKITFSGTAYSYEGDEYQYIYTRVYELSAYRNIISTYGGII